MIGFLRKTDAVLEAENTRLRAENSRFLDVVAAKVQTINKLTKEVWNLRRQLAALERDRSGNGRYL